MPGSSLSQRLWLIQLDSSNTNQRWIGRLCGQLYLALLVGTRGMQPYLLLSPALETPLPPRRLSPLHLRLFLCAGQSSPASTSSPALTSPSFVSQSSTCALAHSTASLPAGAAAPLMSIPCRLRPRPPHRFPPASGIKLASAPLDRIPRSDVAASQSSILATGECGCIPARALGIRVAPRTWRGARPRCRLSPPHPNLARKDEDWRQRVVWAA
ncbi:hypothetical protein DFH09DRAFT_1302997 [Mycena vulgaris]|nr:hypothetical protein DFH09DRAFT_1302997 [Mycena vulgaris]